jgi:hypothetical protein
LLTIITQISTFKSIFRKDGVKYSNYAIESARFGSTFLKGGYYSNVTVFAFKEHLVATGTYFTHLPLFLYILSLNSSKGGA